MPQGQLFPNLRDCESLDSASIWQMRPMTQVDERAAAVHRTPRSIRDFFLDEMNLVFVVFEHL